jgi:hypothetical protein
MSKKWTIVISFKTDNKPDQDLIEEIAMDMRYQLETLEDEHDVKVKAPIRVDVLEAK